VNNVTPLHRGVIPIRPATNDQGMILGEPVEDAEAVAWSMLFFAGLVGFALGLLATAGTAWLIAKFVL
jgi:hypothetical protein